MKLLTHPLLLGSALTLLSACSDFDPGSKITETRVLGAQVTVAGMPELASPRPGQDVDISWIAVSPAGTPSLRSAFVSCLALAGHPEPCAGGMLDSFELDGTDLTLSVPSDAALGDASALTLLGMICDVGAPGTKQDGTPECQGDGAHGTAVTLDVPITRAGPPNENPRIQGLTATLAGQTLVESDAPTGAACDDQALPRITVNGRDEKLVLRFATDPRESVRQAGRDTRERLQISQFSTQGELFFQHMFIEPDDDALTVEQTWTAPKRKEVDATGEVARFVFVVRDLRGGLASTERAACLVP